MNNDCVNDNPDQSMRQQSKLMAETRIYHPTPSIPCTSPIRLQLGDLSTRFKGEHLRHNVHPQVYQKGCQEFVFQIYPGSQDRQGWNKELEQGCTEGYFRPSQRLRDGTILLGRLGQFQKFSFANAGDFGFGLDFD